MSSEPPSPMQNSASSRSETPVIDDRPPDPTNYQGPKSAPYQASIVELVSISATSSAFPESFGLAISSKGRWIVAYSSAALYIILAEELPTFRNTCRAFRLRRKPLAVAITDVGKFAILTSSYKIDVYECGDGSGSSLQSINRKIQTVLLDNEAWTIALSSDGEMVAAASDQGIEIVGLGMGTGLDRRQINCGSVESVTFSNDGKSLLATAPARKSRISTFLTISGSFDNAFLGDEVVEEQPIGKQWISQLLFPEKISARQASFLPDPSNSQISELLAFNPQSEQFGIFDTAMKMFNGKMLGIPEDVTWSRSQRFEDTLPAVSNTGSHIATAVRLKENSEIWTYEMSSEWREEDLPSSSNNQDTDFSNITPKHRLLLPSRDDNGPSENLICLRWMQVDDVPVERLVALINTVNMSMPEDVVPTVSPAASGKIMVFDFKQYPPDEVRLGLHKVAINLDEFSLTDSLADEEVALEREVDIVRRRTQVQRNQQRSQPRQPDTGTPIDQRESRLRRSLSSSSRQTPLTDNVNLDLHSSRPRRRRSFSSVSDVSEDNEIGGAGVAVDEPYSHSAPRSQFTLNRAATVAQNSPASRMHLRSAPTRQVQYRRADGMREHPHESDADDWVPPPPPYTERPDQPGPNAVSLPVPEAVRAAVLQGTHIIQQRQQQQQQMARVFPQSTGRTQPRVSQIMTNVQIPVIPTQNRRDSYNTSRSHTVTNNIRSASQPMPHTNRLPVVHRRPVPSTVTRPEANRVSPSTIFPTPNGTQAMSANTAEPVPILGLNSSMTFPGGRGSRNSNAHLYVPTVNSDSHPTSAPVTPVAYRQRQLPQSNQSQIINISVNHNEMESATLPPNFTMPTSSSSIPSSVSRRVSSADLRRPLPQTSANRRSRHSIDWSQNMPANINRPNVSRITTNSNANAESEPMSAVTSSRRQWWRVGNTPTRQNQTPDTPTPLSQGAYSQSQSATPGADEKEKCVIQ
jgi:hypothetical protein